MKCKMTVMGEPVPQGRPRFSRRSGRAYDPKKSRQYKEWVREVADIYAPRELIECPVRMSVRIYRSIPKSFSKAKLRAIEAGTLRPVTKPDVSNVLKGIEDALNGVWYKDDSQIVEYGEVGKWYSMQPRVEVEIETLEAI